MPKLQDYKPEKLLRWLLVGDSNTGKSCVGPSFPGAYHELDMDNRFEGIWQSHKQGLLKNENISYQIFLNNGGWEPVSKELDRLITQLMVYKANPTVPFIYSGIGVGSLSSLSRLIRRLAIAKLPGHQKLGDNEKTALLLSAPGDVKAENAGVHQVLDYLFDMPCNLFVTCHLCDRWGKAKVISEEDKYKPSEVIGETLTLSPNVAETVKGRFNNVFKFQTRLVGTKVVYEVIFSDGDLAKNTYNIPPGIYDWTGKSFYSFFTELIEKRSKQNA